MKKIDLLQRLAEARSEWEHFLSRVRVERTVEPGVAGSWTMMFISRHQARLIGRCFIARK